MGGGRIEPIYQGLILVPEAHSIVPNGGEDNDGGSVGIIARLPATILHPDDDIRGALDLFGTARTGTLAVTSRETGQVLGTLGEAYAARRYARRPTGRCGACSAAANSFRSAFESFPFWSE
jgi:hypothetical protein